MSETTGLEFQDIDSLLAASMDDLDDLPPVGVPPSGHYNMTVSFDIETLHKGEKDEKQVIAASYLVDAINQVKTDEDASEVAVGQQFKEFFHLTKKDGTKNTFAIGNLKERLKPYAERFGTSQIGDLIQQVKQVSIAATVQRKQNKKNEDQYNVNIKDVVIL